MPVCSYEQLEHYIIRLAKWLSLYPAKILGIDNKRGSIEKGKFADLIIWNPRQKFRVQNNYDYSDTSPFLNQELLGKIHRVYLRGKIAYDNEAFPIGAEMQLV